MPVRLLIYSYVKTAKKLSKRQTLKLQRQARINREEEDAALMAEEAAFVSPLNEPQHSEQLHRLAADESVETAPGEIFGKFENTETGRPFFPLFETSDRNRKLAVLLSYSDLMTISQYIANISGDDRAYEFVLELTREPAGRGWRELHLPEGPEGARCVHLWRSETMDGISAYVMTPG